MFHSSVYSEDDGWMGEKDYRFIRSLSNLFAHELVHPLRCLIVAAAVFGLEAWYYERHLCEFYLEGVAKRYVGLIWKRCREQLIERSSKWRK